MGALLACLGAISGFALGTSRGVESAILSGVFSVLCLLYSFLRKKRLPFLIAFLVLLSVAFLLRFTSPTLGKREVVGIVTKTGENYYVIRTFLDGYYVSSKGHEYQLGDLVRVTGSVKELKITTYESQFSFLSYLENLGAEAEIAATSSKGVLLCPLRIGALEKRFLSAFDASSGALLNASLFGRKDYGATIVNKADGAGLLFSLSSAGLFFSMAMRGFESALLTRLDERKAKAATLVFGAILLPMNIEKIGLWRVYLMRLLGSVKTKRIDFDYYSRLGLSILILVAINPYNALASGLWIGGGLSLARYLFSAFLESPGKKKLPAFLKGYAFVQLFMLPLSVSSGVIHLLSPVLGVLLLPFMGFYLLLGTISFLTFPYVSVIEGYTALLEKVFDFFYRIDLALPFPSLPSWATFSLYVCLFLGLFFHELGLKGFRDRLIIVTVGVYLVSLVPFGYVGLEALYFVNVGQGDCTIVYNRGSAVMIDTGGVVGMDIAEESLLPYLRKKRIYHLDALFITHGDYDHRGGKEKLLSLFNVKEVIEEQDDSVRRYGHITIQNHNVYGGEEANGRSLVLDFEILGKRVIVCGDAPSFVERKILFDVPDIDCDILRVGHHGSDTSTCPEWLDALTPQTAVISCGRKNSYGHPSSVVLKRLEERGIEVRRTDLEGSIELSRFAF